MRRLVEVARGTAWMVAWWGLSCKNQLRAPEEGGDKTWQATDQIAGESRCRTRAKVAEERDSRIQRVPFRECARRGTKGGWGRADDHVQP